MRVMGHNVFAVIAATLLIYVIEFVIFALLISPEQYQAFTGVTADQMQVGMERMPFGILPPLLAAIGLSLCIKWRGAQTLQGGAMTGLILAVLFAFGTSLYGFVYGPHAANYLPVNLVHFLVCWGAAGAVLGAWK